MRLMLPLLLLALTATVAHAETTIESDTLTILQKQNTATFTGNVRAVQPDFTLTAATLTATYGKGGIQSLVANGNVIITRRGGEGETARGETATYTPANKTLIMTGGTVTLTHGANTLAGNRLEYNLATGKANLVNTGPKRVRAVLQEDNTP
jgi:lipopolysaccharide export system protein LptA